MGPPVVLLPACNRAIGDHAFHVVGRKYADAVRLAGALPLIVPGLLPDDVDAALDLCHGVLLTGSASNVHPSHYGQSVHDASLPLDAERDAAMLPLIRQVLARGIPLLAICRGLQELNVALGGSLHQAVQALTGCADHRSDDDDPVALQYGPVHRIDMVTGGRLGAVLGVASAQVNSLHGQGIARLADGLRAEASAPDGVIEAVSVRGASSFALGVQWHPEWLAADNPLSMRLLRAFGDAVREYQAAHRERVRGPLPRGTHSTASA